MKNKFPVYGGRWQPFHLGHLYVVKQIIEKYGNLTIAIVNIDPDNAPDPTFDRFYKSSNILGYWDRYYIMMKILIYEDLWDKVRIVPSWHPRKRITFDNNSLPPKNTRFWILPITSDIEEKKIQDFKDLGESYKLLRELPNNIINYNATQIRQLISLKKIGWHKHVHELFIGLARELKYEEKIHREYNNSIWDTSNNKIEEDLDTLIIVGEFSPFTIEHVNFIRKLLDEYATITVGFTLQIDSISNYHWPNKEKENTSKELNYWQRYNLFRFGVKDHEGLHGSIVTIPIIHDSKKVEINYKFLPFSRSWLIIGPEFDFIESKLVNDGESIIASSNSNFKKIDDTNRSELLNKSQLNFINFK